MKKLSLGLVALLAIVFAVSSAFTSRQSTMFVDKFLVVDAMESDDEAAFFNGQNSPYTEIGRYVEGTLDAELFTDAQVNPSVTTAICDGGTSTDFVCAFNVPEEADDDTSGELSEEELEAYLISISYAVPTTIYFRQSN